MTQGVFFVADHESVVRMSIELLIERGIRMGIFDSKKHKNENNSERLLELHKNGFMNDEAFLSEFGKMNVYYSTPFGDHKDGGNRLFLLPGPSKTGYLPVFSSKERATEFFDKAGRVGFLLISGTFTSVLEATKKVNEGNTPVKMGVIIDPRYYDVTVDVAVLDTVIKMTKQQ